MTLPRQRSLQLVYRDFVPCLPPLDPDYLIEEHNPTRLHEFAVGLLSLPRAGRCGDGEWHNADSAPILVETGGGQQFIVALSGPLTADHPADTAVAEFRANGGTIPVVVESELIVRGNLPAATRGVLQKIGAR